MNITPAQLLDACRQSVRSNASFEDLFIAQTKALIILDELNPPEPLYTEYEAAIKSTFAPALNQLANKQ